MNRAVIAASALLFALVLSSCATIFTGTEDNIVFNSDPTGATILIEGIERGETPATIAVKRPGLGDTDVTFRLEGYEDRVFRLQTEFNAVAILNLAGMVGWAIDIVSGAIMKYDPRNYDLKMRARSAFIDLDDLDRDDAGAYVVPNAHWMVVDHESGLTFVFE